MSNNKKGDTMVDESVNTQEEASYLGSGKSARPKTREKRKVTYERRREIDIPAEIVQDFYDAGWSLRWVLCRIDGVENFQEIAKREGTGLELVTPSELPDYYLQRLEVVNTPRRKNLVIFKDVCLMKAPVELIESRRQFYAKETQHQISSADLFTKGSQFVNRGSKSTISTKEPSFD